MPDSMTQILNSGPPGTKVNIAILGDGFADTDQDLYNQKVQDLVINGLFSHDYYYEDIQAFNVFRVNLISVDSGVSTKTYNNGTLLSERPTGIQPWVSSTTGPGHIAGSSGVPIVEIWSIMH